jgi:hypothetical protein
LPTAGFYLKIDNPQFSSGEIVMAQPELPDTFQERCPMCNCTQLNWGMVENSTPFIPETSGRFAVNTIRFIVAAECQDCGHILLFNRSAR